MMILPVALLLCSVLSVLSLHEDQAGFFDRIARHVGPPNSALLGRKGSVLVGTDAGVIALLNAESGEHIWRFVAPRGASAV